MSAAYLRLRDFLDKTMRMSQIYQPVMLETLLANGGTAPIRAIASAILNHDESQIEYYEQIVKNMPGKVLSKHGIVQRQADAYTFAPDLTGLTDDERADLISRCRSAVERYKAKRGAVIWEHRRPGLGAIPGSTRYETLKRAGYRCELCGISADERALDVDHIQPKSQGGSDEPENLQALCWLCNTNKGAGDNADFRGIRDSYAHRSTDCPFCDVADVRIVDGNDLAVLIEDGFPVTKGHLLAIPRRHVADYFELRQPELNAVQRLLDAGRMHSQQRDPTVAGFNVGINSGEAAGQTVFHCHVHLIPRRAGDVEHPRGGIRAVIPGKGEYQP